MATMGTESMCASAMGVTRLVAPGPEVAMQTPDLAGGAGVALGRVARTLLVAHEDVADLHRVEQRVVGGENGAAGDAEHRVDVHGLEREHEALRARDLDGGLGAGLLGQARRGGGCRLGVAHFVTDRFLMEHGGYCCTGTKKPFVPRGQKG